MLVTPAEKWLVKVTGWLAILCNIIADSLLQSRIPLATIAGFLSIGLFAVAVLGVALRIIWRFCPGWTRWLSSAALLSCALAGYGFFAPPLFPDVNPAIAAFASGVLATVCTMLVVLSAFFTFTELEERRTANR